MLVDHERYEIRSTWKAKYILPYESNISIATKFCALNAYSQYSKSFANAKRERVFDHRGMYDDQKFGPVSFYQILEYDYIKYCPVCIKNGYHSLLHQIRGIDKCFIHRNRRLVADTKHRFRENYGLFDDVFGYSQRPYKCIDNGAMRKRILDSIEKKKTEWSEIRYWGRFNFTVGQENNNGFCNLLNTISNTNLGTDISQKKRCIAEFKTAELSDIAEKCRKDGKEFLSSIPKDDILKFMFHDAYFFVLDYYKGYYLKMKEIGSPIYLWELAIGYKDGNEAFSECLIKTITLGFISERYDIMIDLFKHHRKYIRNMERFLYEKIWSPQQNNEYYPIVAYILNDLLPRLHNEVSGNLPRIIADLNELRYKLPFLCYNYEYDYPEYVVMGNREKVFIYVCE